MLVKMSLSIMVVFSAVVSYLLAPQVQFFWPRILLIALGGFLVTGSANAVNQVVEKDTDALMKRTAKPKYTTANGAAAAAHTPRYLPARRAAAGAGVASSSGATPSRASRISRSASRQP